MVCILDNIVQGVAVYLVCTFLEYTVLIVQNRKQMSIKDTENNMLLIEKYIQKNNKQFTLQDAVTTTGLPLIETKDAIDDLMGKYNCKLRVTENGDLIYDFGTKLEQRHAKTWKDYLWSFAMFCWKGFKAFYKLMTALFLIIYFVVFLLLILGLALSSEDDNGVGDLVAGVFRAFISIFEWSTIIGYNNRYYRNDRYGYRYQHYKEKPRVFNRRRRKKSDDPRDEKGFVASIYDFIFGPPRVELNPLANNQEVASFIKENKGLLTTSEVQALAGWTREDAENFMTETLAYFDGEAKISENGMLYGDFTELLRVKNKEETSPIIWFWDEYEPEYEMTGNSKGRNGIIIAMNTFNLLMSMWVLGSGFTNEFGFAATFFLGVFPLVYSATFFFIPLMRWWRIRKQQHEQHKQNIRKRIMKVVFQSHSREIPLSKLHAAVNENRTTEEVLSAKVINDVLQETIYDLGGEQIEALEKDVIYHFERVGQELDDIDELRKNKKDDNTLGDIVFES